ncbi:DNA-3-methyladenine glycosylase [bacterium]|nr:DNA-3-methyladenine glycosylase [bacterium]
MKDRLKREFYTRDTLLVAKELLGKYIVRKIGERFLVGKIVETEAYIGPKDKASHSYQWKVTKRNLAEFLEGGHIYIYLCYGMYWQLNITTSKIGTPECVLIRAIEPINKFKIKNAKLKISVNNSKFKIKNLTNGPGKLCKWIKLDKSFYGEDLVTSKRIWLEKGEKILASKIVATKRIGIDYAGPWKHKPWRFYIKNNPFVSVK